MGYRYETRTGEHTAMTGADCDKCGAFIPVLRGNPDPLAANLDGGVAIELHGWYGSTLYDPVFGRSYKILCNDCGRKLMEDYFPEELP